MPRTTPSSVCCAVTARVAVPIARIVTGMERALLGAPARFALRVTADTWKRSAAGVLVGAVTAIIFGAVDVLWPAVSGLAYAAFVAYYAVTSLFLFAVTVFAGQPGRDSESDAPGVLERGLHTTRRAGSALPHGAFCDDAIPGYLIGLLLFFDFAATPVFDTAYLVATGVGTLLAVVRAVALTA